MRICLTCLMRIFLIFILHSFSLFFLSRLSFCAAQVSNYCSISGQHSLCLNQGPSSSCGKVYYRGLTEVRVAWPVLASLGDCRQRSRRRWMSTTGWGPSWPRAAPGSPPPPIWGACDHWPCDHWPCDAGSWHGTMSWPGWRRRGQIPASLVTSVETAAGWTGVVVTSVTFITLTMLRFKVGQNIYRARDNRLESPEWGHVIRSFFSEIDLFPGSGSIARYKYNIRNMSRIPKKYFYFILSYKSTLYQIFFNI